MRKNALGESYEAPATALSRMIKGIGLGKLIFVSLLISTITVMINSGGFVLSVTKVVFIGAMSVILLPTLVLLGGDQYLRKQEDKAHERRALLSFLLLRVPLAIVVVYAALWLMNGWPEMAHFF
jgi:hypothetical protein